MSVTLQTPISFARNITGTNSSSLTDSKAIAFGTDALFVSRTEFVKNGVDAGQIQEVYFTPTAGQGQYNFPQGPVPAPFFLLKEIECNFSNTSQTNYVPAAKMDISNLAQGVSVDYLRVNQNTSNPLFDAHGNWFEIFPTPTANLNLTNAIKLTYFIQPSPYVATTDGIAYPESIDPNIIGYGIAAGYLRSIFKFNEADKMEEKMSSKIKNIVPTLGTGGQTSVLPGDLGLSGYEF